MFLRDIELRVESRKSTIVGNSPRCIEDLYLKQLGKVHTNSIAKISIYLEELVNHIHEKKEIASVVDVVYPFNFEYFKQLESNFDKKKNLLDIIHKSVCFLSDTRGWDKEAFVKTYHKVIELGLINEWWFKNKLFKSTDNKYYAGVYHLYDIDLYEIIVVLFDCNKVEIGRKLAFKYLYSLEMADLEQAYWEDNNEVFCLKFKGPKKIFRFTTYDLLNNTPTAIPDKVNDWFK